MTLTRSATARASVTYTKPASAWPSATLLATARASDSWLTTFPRTAERPNLRSTVRVYAPTGTAGPATTSFTGLRLKSEIVLMRAGFDLGTMSASRFAVKVTGFPTSPSRWRRCALRGAAAAKRSAGAPFRICVSSVPELPKLYSCPGSNLPNASVSEDAA